MTITISRNRFLIASNAVKCMDSRHRANTLNMDPRMPSRSPVRTAVKAVASLVAERKDYVIGIALLLIVVFLWAASNFLTQDIFQEGYEKPFLVTYLNTSAFTVYLIPFALKRRFSGGNGRTTREHYEAIPDGIDSNDQIIETARHEHPPLTTRETIKLSFIFCFIWFLANWSVNASLDYTSVASATIMSSMSGFFTLGIGRLFRVETLSFTKVAAVVISFSGVIIVSLSDSSSTTSIALSAIKCALAEQEYSAPLFGDALALSSAMFYAAYVILLKVRIREESRINMQLFFGFVGLFNIISCWPMGLILHWTGIEPFELPSTRKAVVSLLINMFITLSSDYIYVIAMLKTTPLVVTVGLSLTIPVAVAGDFFLDRPIHLLSVFGALLVLVSFVVVGLEDAKQEEEIQGVALEEETVPLRLSEDVDNRSLQM